MFIPSFYNQDYVPIFCFKSKQIHNKKNYDIIGFSGQLVRGWIKSVCTYIVEVNT